MLKHCFISVSPLRFIVELCPEFDCFPDKTLHISVRLNKQIVVRTHRYGGRWGQENISGDMPFTRGNNFTLKIQVTAPKYQVVIRIYLLGDRL